MFMVASMATYAAVGDVFNDSTSGLNFKVLSESPYTVEVGSNVSGAVVYSTIVTDSRFSVSLSNLSKGVYFVRVGNSIRQIIKR